MKKFQYGIVSSVIFFAILAGCGPTEGPFDEQGPQVNLTQGQVAVDEPAGPTNTPSPTPSPTPPPILCKDGQLIDFNNQVLGETFHIGDPLEENGYLLTFGPYNPLPSIDGEAMISDTIPGGSGNGLFLININLIIDLPCPTESMKVRIGIDSSGGINFGINDSKFILSKYGDLVILLTNCPIISGVEVCITPYGDGSRAIIEMNGVIKFFLIGSDGEFTVDDICIRGC